MCDVSVSSEMEQSHICLQLSCLSINVPQAQCIARTLAFSTHEQIKNWGLTFTCCSSNLLVILLLSHSF